MKTVAVIDLKSGEILATHLNRSNGAIMLSKGTKLSRPVIKRLLKMNYKEVVIESDKETVEVAHSQQYSLLERRFKGHEQDQIMMKIKEIVINHAQRNKPTTN